jgi:hypothetical protein
MKYLNSYKLFEKLNKIDLPIYKGDPEELEAKEYLENILLDLKDLESRYSVEDSSVINQMVPTENWYKNTGVEKGFKNYVSIYIQIMSKDHIQEILNIINQCIYYMKNNAWKYSIRKDMHHINVDDILNVFSTYPDADFKLYYKTINISFWKI